VVAYWQKIEERKGQPRHNIHILDNSMLTKLYRLNKTERRIKNHRLVDLLLQQQSDPVPSRSLNVSDHTFFQVLSMFVKDNNVLVIPESVLREFYKGTINPFVGNEGDGWAWGYDPAHESQLLSSKVPWSDKCLMLSVLIHQAFQRDEVSVCGSAEAFAEKFSTFHPDKHLVIVRDKAPFGDKAICDIARAVNPLDFRATSLLSADKNLQASIPPELQGCVSADVITVMDAFAKYNANTAENRNRLSSRESVNELFARAANKNPDFADVRIDSRIDIKSNALLDALGHSRQVGQGRS
jgi:hypothetical protein